MLTWKRSRPLEALAWIALSVLIVLPVAWFGDSVQGQEPKTPPRKFEQKSEQKTEEKTGEKAKKKAENPPPVVPQTPKSESRAKTEKAPKKSEEKVPANAADQKQPRTIQSGTIQSINAKEKTFVLRVEGLTGEPMDQKHTFNDGCFFNRGGKVSRNFPKVGDRTSVVFNAAGIGEYGVIHENLPQTVYMLSCRFHDYDQTTGTIRIQYLGSGLHVFAKCSAPVHIGGTTSSFENLVMNEKITIAWYDNTGTKTLVDLWTDRDYLVPNDPVD